MMASINSNAETNNIINISDSSRSAINTVSGNLDMMTTNSAAASGAAQSVLNPPSYEFVLKSAVVTHEDTLPPSYDSLYQKVKNAGQSLRYSMQNSSLTSLRSTSPSYQQKFNFAIGLLAVFIFFIGLPLLNIIVGLSYKEECPLNRSIPLWLIVDGVFVILWGLSIFLFKYYDCSLMTSILALFLFSWLIRGSVWVYKVRNMVSYDAANKHLYCNYSCYALAFWTITITWSTLIITILMMIISLFYSSLALANNQQQNDSSFRRNHVNSL